MNALLLGSGLESFGEKISSVSQSHIRVAKPAKPRNWGVEAAIGVVAALLAALYVATRFWDGFSRPPRVTAEGRVSETRIVMDHIQDSHYGGMIFYQIEAHVSYELDGRRQDRWLTASEITTERLFLASRIATQPKTCEVYWSPGHPENAKCRLE